MAATIVCLFGFPALTGVICALVDRMAYGNWAFGRRPS